MLTVSMDRFREPGSLGDPRDAAMLACHVCEAEAPGDADGPYYETSEGEPLCEYHRYYQYDALGFGYCADVLLLICPCGHALTEDDVIDDQGVDYAACHVCGARHRMEG